MVNKKMNNVRMLKCMANLVLIIWLQWTNLFQQSHSHFTPMHCFRSLSTTTQYTYHQLRCLTFITWHGNVHIITHHC